MIPGRPLVSVIIPVFNARDFIVACIESVIRQTYPNIEIIAIEDGSAHDSADLIGKFPQVAYVWQEQSGNAAARNAGIKASRGQYISFLDCDDMYVPEKTGVQLDYLMQHPDCQAVSGLTEEFLQPGVPLPVWVRNAALKKGHKGMSPGTLMIRREAFKRVGLFDPSFTMTSDTEWIMRAKRMGMEPHYLERIVLRKRIHAGNQSAHESAEKIAAYRKELTRIFAPHE